MEATRQILEAAERFAAGVSQIEGLFVLGKPVAMMVALGSEELDIHAVGRAVKKNGGFGLSSCQNPPCFHLCTTLRHVTHVDALLRALEASVSQLRAAGAAKKGSSGSADIYGVTDGSGVSEAGSHSVSERLADYLDNVLDMPAKSKL